MILELFYRTYQLLVKLNELSWPQDGTIWPTAQREWASWRGGTLSRSRKGLPVILASLCGVLTDVERDGARQLGLQITRLLLKEFDHPLEGWQGSAWSISTLKWVLSSPSNFLTMSDTKTYSPSFMGGRHTPGYWRRILKWEKLGNECGSQSGRGCVAALI